MGKGWMSSGVHGHENLKKVFHYTVSRPCTHKQTENLPSILLEIYGYDWYFQVLERWK